MSQYGKEVLILFQSAENGDLDSLKAVLKRGVVTVHACLNDRSALHTAALHGRAEAVKYLLSENADTKAVDKNWLLPIHYAAARNHEDVISLLAKVDPSTVSMKDIYGVTALHLAASSASDVTVETLIKHGANIYSEDYEDKLIPYDYASEPNNTPVLKLLEKLMKDYCSASSSSEGEGDSDVFSPGYYEEGPEALGSDSPIQDNTAPFIIPFHNFY